MPVRRRLTWRDVVASLVLAAAMPALVWSVQDPVRALAVTVAVAVAVSGVRALRRRDVSRSRPEAATVARIVRRIH